MTARLVRRLLPQTRGGWLVIGLFLLGTVAAAGAWNPQVRQVALSTLRQLAEARADDDHHDRAEASLDAHGHAESGHDHEADKPGEIHNGEAAHAGEEAGHDHPAAAPGEATPDHKHIEAEAVKLSQTAQANVGLQLAKVELRGFERTITVPAIIMERPGRTRLQVAATLAGVITRVWPMQGEAVTPGQALFDLRLAHEGVAEAQAEFLKTAEELDVLGREIDRLEKVASEGVVPGKTLLERKYEQQKLRGVQRSQRQRLLLHGLSAEQVDQILAKRTLLSAITVTAPKQVPGAGDASGDRLLQVQELKVETGQHVHAGDPLCVLADHCQLFIEGKAFEQDVAALEKVANNDWRVTAVVDGNGPARQTVADLRLLYVANKVEPESRAFLFYVQLPNRLIRDRQTADGHRFSAWQFKPGQRVELLVPVERWADRIVLPVNALVQEGAEFYVFEKNDGHFDRRAVRVLYRDPFSAIIDNDGALTPGKSVIISGSYQVHLAMKNKAGGAPDPHAGHNH